MAIFKILAIAKCSQPQFLLAPLPFLTPPILPYSGKVWQIKSSKLVLIQLTLWLNLFAKPFQLPNRYS